MAGVSKMRLLPKEVLDDVDQMFEEGETITCVHNALESEGHDVSRSGVGKYRKEWAKAHEKRLVVREFCRLTTKSLEDEPESRLSQMNAELLETSLFTAITALTETLETRGEQAVGIILEAARAKQALSRAQKDDVERIIKATEFAEKYAAQAVPADQNTLQVEFVNVPKTAKKDAKAKNGRKGT